MGLNKPNWLRLDLQFFAEGGDPTPPEPPVTDPPTSPEAKYTQADIDRIVGERLAREKAKAEKAIEDAKAEAERKKLEEANEFKTLYEKAVKEKEQLETERKAEKLQQSKVSKLLEAGYANDKVNDLLEFVTGDDEETVKASIDRLVKIAPPKELPVDPTLGGGGRTTPPKNDGGYEAARERARKLLKRK